MEKEIEIIKSLINDLKREEKLIGYDAESEIQAIEKLIKGYRELEERIIYLVNERKKLEELLFVSNENYIEKLKVKEKIGEINQEKLNYSEDEWYLESEIKAYAIEKLQELMEDK